MDHHLLISFCISTFLLALSPGPDNIYVLMQSITHGKRFGLATVFGLISGCLIHTTLVALGISAIIKNNDNLFLLIKISGAIYLFYLAFTVLKSKSEFKLNSEEIPKKSEKQLFIQGFIMNVLNPKVTLFFLAFFPGFLFSDTMSHISQFYILGVLFMFISLMVFSSFAILAGAISDYIHKHHRLGVFIKWFQVFVFILIAILILI